MYFSAKLVFETRPLAHGEDSTSIEESIVLLIAPNEKEAEVEANLIGKRNEYSYEASDGGQVVTSFLGVRKIYRLIDDTIGHGTEIDSESEFLSND